MTSSTLRLSCMRKFGRIYGDRLFELMKTIKEQDFCVATSWNPFSISIANSCNSNGRVFSLSEDYGSIMLPDNRIISFNNLTREDILPYLANPARFDQLLHKNCFADQPEYLARIFKQI